MTFPTNPSNGDQYPNTDNGYLYEWQDPPGAWNVIGTIDDGSTPGGPGEGLVEGTEPRFQWIRIDSPSACSHSADDISVKVDNSKVLLSNTNKDGQGFSYSYDFSTWNLGTLTGGVWTGDPVNMARGASGGGQLWVTKEKGGSSGFFKSTDGINWTVSTVTGPLNAHHYCGISRENVLLFSVGSSATDFLVWYSSDQGASWTSNNLNYRVARESVFIDDDAAIIGQTSGSNCQVSVDGGVTFRAMTGMTITNWSQVRITASVSGPKVYYAKDMATNVGTLYYVTLADLEAGNTAWTALPNGSNLFFNSVSRFFQCYSIENVNYIVEVANGSRALITKLSSDNLSVDDWRVFSPLESLGTQNFFVSEAHCMPQPARMILARTAINDTSSGALVGFAPDLYFNGIKVGFSSMTRTEFS